MKQKAFGPDQRKAFRDNYLAAIIAVMALFLSTDLSAQSDSAKYSRINGYGFVYKRMAFDSIMILPPYESPHIPWRPGALTYRKSDSTVYVWTGYQKIPISGAGGGIDTLYMVNDSTMGIEKGDLLYFMVIRGTPTTASNGLIKEGNDIRLGRPLNSETLGSELLYDTEIPMNDKGLYFISRQIPTFPYTGISKRGIDIYGDNGAGVPARLRLNNLQGGGFGIVRNDTLTLISFRGSYMSIHDRDSSLIFTKIFNRTPTAFHDVDGTGRYRDTLTATTMGLSDSSDRVATTAGVKRIVSTIGGSQNLQQTTDIGATTTNTIVAADVKFNGISNYSEKRRATNLYGYRDSTGVKFAIPRPSIDGSGNVTWPIIGLDVGDTDHEPIGFTSAVANGSGQLELNYPSVKQVHNSVIVPDEQIVKLIGGIGGSVGLSKSTFFVYRQATWGGQYAWNPTTSVWYNDGADINGGGATVTYSPDSGLVRITISTIMTTGSERDFKKFTANINRPDLDVFLRSDLSSNTVLCFQVTDRMGDVPPTYVFNGSTAINIIGPTWPKQVPLNYMGGSAAWMQPFFTTAANLFIQQTHKLLQ